MSAPEPSPMMKPSRDRSKGREAFSGWSLNFDERARKEQNPAKTSGVMLASAPTTITTSARPSRIQWSACPSAWALEEQAVEMVRLGPLAPQAIAIMPEAELRVITGIKFGWTR